MVFFFRFSGLFFLPLSFTITTHYFLPLFLLISPSPSHSSSLYQFINCVLFLYRFKFLYLCSGFSLLLSFYLVSPPLLSPPLWFLSLSFNRLPLVSPSISFLSLSLYLPPHHLTRIDKTKRISLKHLATNVACYVSPCSSRTQALP